MTSQPASNPSSSKLAACGLDCEACEIGKAAKDPAFAEQLAKKWGKVGDKVVTADWFKCEGCHGRKEVVWCGDDCKIRNCCIDTKHLDNCSLCPQFPCEITDAFEANTKYPHHGKAIRRLKSMKANREG